MTSIDQNMKESARINSVSINIEAYYTKKIKEFGPIPQGVDWNGEESQVVRFKQLSKIIPKDNFSLSDIGCGYGRYNEYLQNNYSNFTYVGYDLSSEMINQAKRLYDNNPSSKFIFIDKLDNINCTDYSVASGIFGVKMHYTNDQWLKYILDTLEVINAKSTKGFAFNMITKYSDEHYMKSNLYYADPLFLFDYCKRNFSKNVSLLHDYGLYEFTILVRKG
jgi:SAM-dependent methyltransferase